MGPWGPTATRLYGYWLVVMVIGYVDMSYMNLDYEYWLFTIGYGILYQQLAMVMGIGYWLWVYGYHDDY